MCIHKTVELNDEAQILNDLAKLASTCAHTHSVAERTDYPWHIIYQFISNRIQSIRQDITFQVSTYEIHLNSTSLSHIHKLHYSSPLDYNY